MHRIAAVSLAVLTFLSAPVRADGPQHAAEARGFNVLCGKDVELRDFCFPTGACPVDSCTSTADCGEGERCLTGGSCGYNICVAHLGYCSGGGIAGFYQECGGFQEVVDQSQPVGDGVLAIFSQGDLAQSFAPRLPNITSAEVLLRDGYGTQGMLTISLWSALPSAGGAQLVEGATLARAGEWARVRFDETPLMPGRTYYLAVESTEPSLGVSGTASDTYPRGHAFANPGYQSFPTFDYTFRTFGHLPIFFDGFESTSTAAWAEPPVCTVAFDDAYAALPWGSVPETFYATFGVHFAGSGFLIPGEGGGDLGNWNIEGTWGSAAWGVHAGILTISFDAPVRDVSLDFLRGWLDVTVAAQASLDGTLVGGQTVQLTGAHASEPVTFAGPLDEIAFSTTNSAGVDNLVYRGLASCP